MQKPEVYNSGSNARYNFGFLEQRNYKSNSGFDYMYYNCDHGTDILNLV